MTPARTARHSLAVLRTVLVLCLILAGTQAAHAVATFTVINADGAGEGFNDPSPFVPTGGNPATTLGEARLIAFQHAAFLWASCLTSRVEIQIEARMDPLPGDANSAVLGAAGPDTFVRDFVGAPLAATWYPVALANSLHGFDLAPVDPDIGATFNSDVDGAILGAVDWYYGLDGNPPGNDIDFVSVVLHELGHGLGFSTLVDPATGAKAMGFDDIYMTHLECHGTAPPRFTDKMDAGRVAASVSDPDLHWDGANTLADAAALPLTAGFPANHVQIHAPNPFENGSSLSHFSTNLVPNQLMEPSYTGPNHDVGLALPLLEDLGWSIQPKNGTDIVFLMDTTGSTGALLPDWVSQIPMIADAWRDFDPNARFALASHVDFPFAPHGLAGEWGYRVETVFDPDTANLQAALGLLMTQNGLDVAESQYEAIFQVLTSQGRDLTPPMNFVDPGEIPPVPLGQLFPMVIYHFTFPEQFHDRDLEPDYPFAGSNPVAGRADVLNQMATSSSFNMFFGLTFIGDPALVAGSEDQKAIPARGVDRGGPREIFEGPLAEIAALTGGGVFEVGQNDLSLLQEAIGMSIERFAESRQVGDADRDGIPDAQDNCPLVPNPDQLDSDGDRIGDACDNCPDAGNPNQLDENFNGVGNVCEAVVAGDCVAGPTTLCLNEDRFEVRVHWETSFGTSGDGQAKELTEDTGYFWFFEPDNVEVVLKVLNGCPVNGRFWVFAAGLTNVGVEISVTDTESGLTQPYQNSLGTPFAPIQDTAAFATCP